MINAVIKLILALIIFTTGYFTGDWTNREHKLVATVVHIKAVDVKNTAFAYVKTKLDE